jgi:hypothetical protein
VLPSKGRDGKYHVEGRHSQQRRGEEDGQHCHPPSTSGRPMPQVYPDPGRPVQVLPVLYCIGPCEQLARAKLHPLDGGKVDGAARDYVRMRNIKRASIIEMSQLLTTSAVQRGYLQEEEIWG